MVLRTHLESRRDRIAHVVAQSAVGGDEFTDDHTDHRERHLPEPRESERSVEEDETAHHCAPISTMICSVLEPGRYRSHTHVDVVEHHENTVIAAIATFEPKPMPNHSKNSGASAILDAVDGGQHGLEQFGGKPRGSRTTPTAMPAITPIPYR
jgi:hypothetical protein